MGWALSAYADELAAAVLVGLPACLGLAWAFHHWRRGDSSAAAVRRDALLDGLMVASVLPFLYVTLSQGYGNQRVVSLMPFGELSASFGSSQVAFSDVTLLNVGGNAALLFVLGALLPVRSGRFASAGRVAGVAALLSAGVEIAQYVLAVGRVSSVDDVLVNTAGAVVGALVTRRWWRRRDAGPSARARSSASFVS